MESMSPPQGSPATPESPSTPQSQPPPRTDSDREQDGEGAARHPLTQNNHGFQNQNSLHSPQPQSPDPVHDLPEELLQTGWRRFWSKREGRPYYFNKNTNESLWEMPQLEAGVSI